MPEKRLTAEPPTITEAEFENALATDNFLMDYFNEFLSLPTFSEAIKFNADYGVFEVINNAPQLLEKQLKKILQNQQPRNPIYDVVRKGKNDGQPVQVTVPCEDETINVNYNIMCLSREQGIQWIKKERLPAFLESDCYFEYRLAKLVSQVRWSRSGMNIMLDTDISPWVLRKPPTPPPPRTEDDNTVLMKKFYVSLGEATCTQTKDWFALAKQSQHTVSTFSLPSSVHHSRIESPVIASESESFIFDDGVHPRTKKRPSETTSLISEVKEEEDGSVSLRDTPSQALLRIYIEKKSGVSENLTLHFSTCEEFLRSFISFSLKAAIHEMLGQPYLESQGFISFKNVTEVVVDECPELMSDKNVLFSEATPPPQEMAEEILEETSSKSESVGSESRADWCISHKTYDIGNRKEFERFKKFIKGTLGERYLWLWMDIERLKVLKDAGRHQRHLEKMKKRYLSSSGDCYLSAEILTKFKLLDGSQWNNEHLRNIQTEVVKPLLLYWAPRFCVTHSFAIKHASAELKLWHLRQEKPRKDVDPFPQIPTLLPLRPKSCTPQISDIQKEEPGLVQLSKSPKKPPTATQKPWKSETWYSVSSKDDTAGKGSRHRRDSNEVICLTSFTDISECLKPQLDRKYTYTEEPLVKTTADGALGGFDMENLLQSLYVENRSGFFFTKFCEHSGNKLWQNSVYFWFDLQAYHQLFYQDTLHPVKVCKQAQRDGVTSSSQAWTPQPYESLSTESTEFSSCNPLLLCSLVKWIQENMHSSQLSDECQAAAHQMAPTYGKDTFPGWCSPLAQQGQCLEPLQHDDCGRTRSRAPLTLVQRETQIGQTAEKNILLVLSAFDIVKNKNIFNKPTVLLFQYLFATYVAPSATLDIGLQQEKKREIYMKIQPPFEDLFDTAEEYILLLLLEPWTMMVKSDQVAYKKAGCVTVNIVPMENINASHAVRRAHSLPSVWPLESTADVHQVNLVEETRQLDSTCFKKLQALHKVTHSKKAEDTTHEIETGISQYPAIPKETQYWNNVPAEYRHFTFDDLLKNKLEFEHFRQFLEAHSSNMDLMCWTDIEQFRRISYKDQKQREAKSMYIKNKYLNKKYFFGPNSPASLRQQDKIMNMSGGWGSILHEQLEAPVLLEVQKRVLNRLENVWLPLFLASEQFTTRQKIKVQLRDIAEELLIEKHEGKIGIWKPVESKWISSSCEIIAFRKALLNPITARQFQRFVALKGDLLENGVLFWQEVQKYKDLCHSHCEESIIHQKITTIINCFINSSIPPALQIDIPLEQAQKIIEHRKELGPYVFREAQMTIFGVLFKFWPQFCEFRKNLTDEKIMSVLERKQEYKKKKLAATEDEKLPKDGVKQYASVSGAAIRTGGLVSDSVLGLQAYGRQPSWCYSKYIEALEQERILLKIQEELEKKLFAGISSFTNVNKPAGSALALKKNLPSHSIHTAAAVSQPPSPRTNLTVPPTFREFFKSNATGMGA